MRYTIMQGFVIDGRIYIIVQDAPFFPVYNGTSYNVGAK